MNTVQEAARAHQLLLHGPFCERAFLKSLSRKRQEGAWKMLASDHPAFYSLFEPMAIASFSTISGLRSRDHSLHVGDIFTDDPRVRAVTVTVRDISANLLYFKGSVHCTLHVNVAGSNPCIIQRGRVLSCGETGRA